MYKTYCNDVCETFSTFEEAFANCDWCRFFGWDYTITKNGVIIMECHDYSYWLQTDKRVI